MVFGMRLKGDHEIWLGGDEEPYKLTISDGPDLPYFVPQFALKTRYDKVRIRPLLMQLAKTTIRELGCTPEDYEIEINLQQVTANSRIGLVGDKK